MAEREKVMRTCATNGCFVEFDAATDYAGNPHPPTRRYHSELCRSVARNDVRRARTEHASRFAALQELHELEASGQLALVADPLPLVPPRPSLAENRYEAPEEWPPAPRQPEG